MTSSVIEETMKRIQSHRGVEAILIVDKDGHVIKSNLKERSEEHAALLSQLVRRSKRHSYHLLYIISRTT
jgi:predicted regulator of Ras-like GTPase activity (Roadblock/LC7/MglB family)